MPGRSDNAPNKALAKKFEALLDAERPERAYQKFLEEHPEFLLLPFLLNHQLHFGAIVSQFRLNTELTADFCYLTKSTAEWWLVLIELERPNIQLFRKDKLQLTPTADFSARLAQIQTWKDQVMKRSADIIRQVEVIRHPLAYNDVTFKYVLIIGRDQAQGQEKANARMVQLNGTDTRILTFDSLLRHYRSGYGETCNIITLNKGKVRFKHLNVEPDSILRWMSPSDIVFTAKQKTQIEDWGVSIKDWENGDPYPTQKALDRVFTSLKRPKQKQ
jgi:hypothetical protein